MPSFNFQEVKREQTENIDNSAQLYIDRIWELANQERDKYEVGDVIQESTTMGAWLRGPRKHVLVKYEFNLFSGNHVQIFALRRLSLFC